LSKKSDYVALIKQLRENVPDITGVMIGSVDGLAICTDFPDAEAARIAAMGASSIGLGNRISDMTELGGLTQMMIEGRNELLIIYMSGAGAILALRAPIRSNLGLIRLEGSKAARRTAELVAG
jgi:uncharacterized protein